MALSPCNTCRRHIRADADCPFCGASRGRTTLGHWGTALLAVTLPLGVACDSKDPSSAPTATTPAKAPQDKPAEPEAPPEPETPEAEVKPPTPAPPIAETGDTPEPAPAPPKPDENTKPEGDTPAEPAVRPARKYGAPPRPRPKYGAPPRPEPKPKPLGPDASKMKKHSGGDKPR